jgi:hypothetical protein
LEFPQRTSRAGRARRGAPDTSLLAKARSYERGFPQFAIDPVIHYQDKAPIASTRS